MTEFVWAAAILSGLNVLCSSFLLVVGRLGGGASAFNFLLHLVMLGWAVYVLAR